MLKAEQADFKPFDAHDWHVGLVVAQFNREITEKLMRSALERAKAYGIPSDNIDTYMVAGAIEIPLVLKKLALGGRYQALLAIGCVINGETPHFKYVCKFVTEGILRVQLDHMTPIGFGVLTCNDELQAQTRSNLGGAHLDAVLQQTNLLRSI